ncbi:MAG: iron-containing alcohol dehydrogenase [Gammaproteobacteria bacterium]|nr:iron-containing alcohol dehydrogenase [Gammaproteobacteria bacterium]
MTTNPHLASVPFSIARLPRIEVGAGVVSKLPAIVRAYGRQVLLVTGARSFQEGPCWERLMHGLMGQGIDWCHCRVEGEPTPDLVDAAVAQYAGEDIECVLGIGGGSALDAAKAIAGLLRVRRSVMDYLEGVGPELKYEGPAVPFIAVPTTAGTGSEATKNAVLSRSGVDGFKKSFRDDKLVAEYAVVDPELLAGCPPGVIAANGMDALTQLLESYVSLRANPMTDALALSGLAAVRDGLIEWHDTGATAREAQARMAYAALLSGITLAQAGLGSVHGLASPLGAYYPIPHGVVCGTLVGAATEVNLEAMRAREPDNRALGRYAEAAEVLMGQPFARREEAWDALLALLGDWTERLRLPRLRVYGLEAAGFDHVVANARGSSMKTNPIALTDAEIRRVLELRR